MRLIVARHGESEYGRRGLANGDPTTSNPLTPEGIGQARFLGQQIREMEIETAVVTEFERTRNTAEIALEGRNVPFKVVAELNDPPQPGFDGRPLDDYFDWLNSSEWHETPPGGGESQLQSVARYLRGWRRVVEIATRPTLVVAHAFPISLALTIAARERPALKRNYEHPVDLAQVYPVDLEQLSRGLDALSAEHSAAVQL